MWANGLSSDLEYKTLTKKLIYIKNLNSELAKKARGDIHSEGLIKACRKILNEKPRISLAIINEVSKSFDITQ